jgi:hypothetical protein
MEALAQVRAARAMFLTCFRFHCHQNFRSHRAEASVILAHCALVFPIKNPYLPLARDFIARSQFSKLRAPARFDFSKIFLAAYVFPV